MTEADLQRLILKTLETDDSLSLSKLVEEVGVEEEAVEEAVSELVDRNLVTFQESKEQRVVENEAPVPISALAFRGELTPTQSVIKYLYEERGYGQSQIARMLDYTPTNLARIEEKLGRELSQNHR